MKINPYIFRGYDLRGLVGSDLNPELMEHLGMAFGAYLKRRSIKKAVVGYDSRLTSRQYADALIRGLNWAGIDVIDIGLTLVGVFYWSQYYFNVKGGAFITASHNPVEYNGVKFSADFSETLVSDGIQELKRMVEKEDYVKGEKIGLTEKKEIRDAYTADLKKRISIYPVGEKFAGEVGKKFKVVVDASCATAGVVVPDILRAFGAEVIESNCQIDPSFPLGTPDPTGIQVAERLKAKVMAENADIGFSYDTDGDRIGVVDEKGGIIWNDVLVALFAIDVLSAHPAATIMYNILCSRLVEETILKYRGRPFMWRTGHSFLKKKNQEVKAAFIGELSGHFFFSADFYNHDDGVYSALRLLKYLARTKQRLSEAIAGLPFYISSPEIKLCCADDKKAALIEKITPIVKNDFPEAGVIDDERAGDGLRLDLEDGMFVIRYSQNGPYLTVKFEGKTQKRYDQLKKYISGLLHKFDEIDWHDKTNVNVESLIK